MSASLCQPKEAIALEKLDKKQSHFQLAWVSCDRGLLKGERVEEAIASATFD